MGTGQLLAGNLATLAITIFAFLQLLPWPIAGYLIIASVLITSVTHLNSVKVQTLFPEGRTVSTSERALEERVSQKQVKRPEQQMVEPQAEPKEPRPRRVNTKTFPPREIPSEEKPQDAPTRIGEGDYLSFSLELDKGQEVVGEIACSGDVNVYVLTEDNLTAIDSDQEFWYEAGNEGVRNTTIRFTAPEDGEWYLVVENAGDKEAFATVKTNVSKVSHALPMLRAEGLGLPGEKLEGKL